MFTNIRQYQQTLDTLRFISLNEGTPGNTSQLPLDSHYNVYPYETKKSCASYFPFTNCVVFGVVLPFVYYCLESLDTLRLISLNEGTPGNTSRLPLDSHHSVYPYERHSKHSQHNLLVMFTNIR